MTSFLILTNSSFQPLPPARSENSSLKRASTGNGNLKERMGQFRSESSASETDGLARDIKRQKNLDNKSGKDASAPLPTNAPNDICPTGSICSFCQSSKISEVTFYVHQFPACFHCFCIPPFTEKLCYPHAIYAAGLIAKAMFLVFMVNLCRLLGQCCIMQMGT